MNVEEIEKQISNLEDFMFWCSGRKGLNGYKNPFTICALKRKTFFGRTETKEYEVINDRLRNKISNAIEEELKILKEEYIKARKEEIKTIEKEINK